MTVRFGWMGLLWACQGGSDPAAVMVGLAIDPEVAEPVDIGGSLAFTATASYDDDTTADVTDAAAWTSSDPAVGSIEAGVLEALGKGATTVGAELDGFQAEVDVEVTDPGPYRATVEGDWSLQHGGQGQEIFARIVDDADGSVVACGSVVSESAEWTLTADDVLLAGHTYHGEAFADVNDNRLVDDNGHAYVGESEKPAKKDQKLVVSHSGLPPDWFGEPCDPATPTLTGE
ncbi:MAG: hypothetical protein ABMA64_36230 [Myxococcota bacterium]